MTVVDTKWAYCGGEDRSKVCGIFDFCLEGMNFECDYASPKVRESVWDLDKIICIFEYLEIENELSNER